MSSKVPSKTKERKKTSWVWKYFEKDPSKRQYEGEKYVLCKVEQCNDPTVKVLGGNTTILSHHLREEHNILPPPIDRVEISASRHRRLEEGEEEAPLVSIAGRKTGPGRRLTRWLARFADGEARWENEFFFMDADAVLDPIFVAFEAQHPGDEDVGCGESPRLAKRERPVEDECIGSGEPHKKARLEIDVKLEAAVDDDDVARVRAELFDLRDALADLEARLAHLIPMLNKFS